MKMDKNHSTNSPAEFAYRGAGVLVELHEQEMNRFFQTWEAAKDSGAKLPAVDEPDYESFETLLRHVLRWSRGYMRWICKQLELPDPGIDPVPETDAIQSEASVYLRGLLDAWKKPLRDVDQDRIFKGEYTAPWGVTYSIEAMLEHAVMHPARHRFQLEQLIDRQRG